MKKAVVILAVMLLVFTACGNNSAAVTLGTISGAVYESEFLGIGCALPEGYSFYTQEEIAQNNSATYDMLSEDLGNQLENADVIYDMAAADDSGSSVNVNIENLGVLGLTVNSAEEYAQSGVSMAVASLEEMGFTDVQATQSTIPFAGSEHPAIVITASFQGITCYQTCVCIMAGNYMGSISVGSMDKATHDALLNSFYALTPTA